MNKQAQFNRREFLRKSTAASAGVVGLCACGGVVCGKAYAAVAAGKFQYDGYCGDYCGACPNMVASEAAAKSSDIKCFGCKLPRPGGKKATCQIRACAVEKGVQHCSACKDYPCTQLRAYHTRSRSKVNKAKPGYTWLAAYNLERIKAVGVEKWLDEQRERWTCPKCKTRFSWKDETCPKCHVPILSADQEAGKLSQRKLPGM